MASISKVSLEIVQNKGAAAALVSYVLTGSAQDIQLRRVYVETVELIGVDQIPGEDGQNDLIADGRTDNSVVFPLSTPNRTRLLALPAARLNEDLSSGRLSLPDDDEIRARVTLRQVSGTTVVAESNMVIIPEVAGRLPTPV